MDDATKLEAEAILTRLCVGRRVCGAHFFGHQPVLLLADFDGAGRTAFLGPLEAYLHVESRWQLFDAEPGTWPRCEEDVPVRSVEEFAQAAASLRTAPITAAALGPDAPHLRLRFQDGRTFFVNGYHPQYEVWSLYAGDWTVFAMQRGEITWAIPEPDAA